ncbi:hypothetical protein N7E81_06855 [Reichenbachiella carrageenanivorans]|uniref:HprK-related kinase B n=1 Tax=Reichenbachiella carrageenanivorans TaxID=2979869 RepID=A0ABY6D3T3_9BACT|nr:hypothetical protein [Reichenbachiella carrageenanivorans]UXX80817.1 hypothetical protein N7E81_06855 [Reichenbachiella carrageenanivorans]
MNKSSFLAFYRQLEVVYQKAKAASPCYAHTIDFARQGFLAHFIGDETDFFYKPALTHLLTKSTNHDFEVFVLEGLSSNVALPSPSWKWNEIPPTGEIYRDDDFILTFESWCGVLRVFNRKEKKAYLWIQSITALPQWMRSFPLRSIVDWYFEPTAIQPVHSGGIALGNNGIMLTGKGGSGKSSTCLSCLNHDELKYLGDDFMLVNCENGKEAFSLYNVAKVEFENLEKFKFLEPHRGKFKKDDEKYQIFLNEIMPNKLTNNFEIDAIFLPKITGSKKGKLIKADASDALLALAPSTISLLKGNRELTFNKVSNLVKKLPAYTLELSSDFERNPEIIYNYLNK